MKVLLAFFLLLFSINSYSLDTVLPKSYEYCTRSSGGDCYATADEAAVPQIIEYQRFQGCDSNHNCVLGAFHKIEPYYYSGTTLVQYFIYYFKHNYSANSGVIVYLKGICTNGGTFNQNSGYCQWLTSCPTGQTRNEDGLCEEPCPQGQVRDASGQCVQAPCPEGQVMYEDGCDVAPDCAGAAGKSANDGLLSAITNCFDYCEVSKCQPPVRYRCALPDDG